MPTIDTSTCEQIRCGAVKQSSVPMDTLLQCSMAGYVGSRNCDDPTCKPYVPQIMSAGTGQSLQCRAQIPVTHTDVQKVYVPTVGTPAAAIVSANQPMPKATNTALPAIVTQAKVTSAMNGEMPMASVLDPRALLNPLPQIVPSPQSLPLPQVCDMFTAWVSSNPLLAVLGLIGAYYLVTKK